VFVPAAVLQTTTGPATGTCQKGIDDVIDTCASTTILSASTSTKQLPAALRFWGLQVVQCAGKYHPGQIA
jgi:hypothetical protein